MTARTAPQPHPAAFFTPELMSSDSTVRSPESLIAGSEAVFMHYQQSFLLC